MKKYLLITSIIFTILIALFLIAELLEIPYLADSSFAETAGWHICWIGVLLLGIDVLVPVPSSLVMITLGYTHGIFMGAVWSFLGVMTAAVFGFSLGRSAQRLVGNFVTDNERRQANSFIDRWGMVGIIVTRPMPLLAETIVLIAGTTGFTWKRLLIASALGNAPIALLYAWTGATARSINSAIWSFLFAVGIAGVFWAVNYGIRLKRRT